MESTFMNNFEFGIDGVLSLTCITLGLSGNILTILTLSKLKASASNTFLLALSVCDSLVLVGSLLLITLPQFSGDYVTNVMPYVVTYVYPLALTAQTSTTWIIVSYTLVRYIAVAYSLHAASLYTNFRAKITVSAVCAVSLLFNACRWLEFRIVTPGQVVGALGFEQTEFGRDEVYRTIYYVYLYPTFMLVLPLCFLVVLSSLMIHALRRSLLSQQSMNVMDAKKRNITKMLVALVLVFTVCQIPALVYNIAYGISSSISQQSGWRILSSSRNFTVTFNSSINFVIYCCFVQRFRVAFKDLFCSKTVSNRRSRNCDKKVVFQQKCSFQNGKIRPSSKTTADVESLKRNIYQPITLLSSESGEYITIKYSFSDSDRHEQETCL